ncbi:MAG: PKD domain-containing protein [Bacteroidota bacterium]
MARIFLIISSLLFACAGYSQTVDFTYQGANGQFCSPASVQFTSSASGTPSGYVWSFGNGIRAYTANPTASYIGSGSYVVKLIAIYPTGTVETSKTVVISPRVLPTLSADNEYICQPGVVNFSAASSGMITSYEWDYGDSTGLSSTPGNASTHNYANYGTYNAIVKATDVTGCVGYDTLNIEVKRPPITGAVTPTGGCIPSTSNFTSSVELPTGGSVSSYVWNFGDGTPTISSGSGSIGHAYTVVGGYQPTLTITTNQGCSNSFNYEAVAFGTPPTGHVASAQDTVVCGSETPVFFSTATNANKYTWDFGDSVIQNVTDTVASHKYKTLGVKTVSVTPYYNNCPGTTISFPIRIIGVIATYKYGNTCSDKTAFTFTNTSLGIQSTVAWDFGDSSLVVNTTNTAHNYPDEGAYPTSLTITDSTTGCQDIYSEIIYTAAPGLINPDTSICRNSYTDFSIADNFTNPAATYDWYAAGKYYNTGGTPSITVTAEILGSFNNYVIVRNGAGIYCPDTLYLGKNMIVRGPDLNYDVPSDICAEKTINILNYSKPFQASDPINEYYWNYGSTFDYDSVYQPLPYAYGGDGGGYTVTLAAKDIRGCVDTLRKAINVRRIPFLVTLPRIDTLCAGASTSLFAFHDNPIIWSPAASLSCNNCDTVTAQPTATTLYKVTSTNSFNCTVEDSVLVKLYSQFTVSKVSPDPYICLNDQVQLEVAPKDKLVVWSPAAGLSGSTIHNPVANPTQTTVYTATLTDSVGCFSNSVDVTVYVKSLPQVDAGPDLLISYNTPFTLTPVYSSNVRSYLWTPSTGLSCTTCAAPGGIALKSMSYTIEVTSDSGCVAKDSINLTIDCKDAYILMPKAFTPNNDNLNDTYYPITRGVKNINRFIIYNRGGQVIFEARNFRPNDKFKSWDGYFKGEPQSPGSFVYVLEAVCDTGETLKKSGSLILLR